MACKLSDEDMANLKAAFVKWDTDGDGVVSASELAEVHIPRVMRASGKNPTDEFIETKTREVDVDESGGISFDEFVTYITEFVMSEAAENLMASFKLFDADGSGFITMQQFRLCPPPVCGALNVRRVMQSTGEPLTDDQVNQLIEDMHVQSDGKIDYKQFARMIIEN